MKLIAIDGACRRNGKPDCVSAAGVFMADCNEAYELSYTGTYYIFEKESTNQRGELLALLRAMCSVCATKEDTVIITDSEYLFNCMTKDWCRSWINNDWHTSTGNEVKNADLWKRVYSDYCHIVNSGKIDITFVHIKGHCIPFGKVTATHSLDADQTGAHLYSLVCDKYDLMKDEKSEELEYAQQLSEKNNGFRFEEKQLKLFVAMNAVADAVATKAVEEADR